MKVAILIPYFGGWPSYFNVYLQGCIANQWLDVFFFTDCKPPQWHPDNVRFIASSLPELSKLASQKLGYDLNIVSAYKLCDLKPAYGKVFEDYINGYDYWGYGDIDLVYGNLAPFVFPRIEQGFDILSSRKELLSGSFSLFRNHHSINLLYTQINNFFQLINIPSYQALDETGHSNVVWTGGTFSELPETCFTWVVANEHSNCRLKASFQTICKEHIARGEVIKYSEQALVAGGTPLGYYHYVCNKNRPEFKLPDWQIVPQTFYVAKTGFYSSLEYKAYHLARFYRTVSGNIKWLCKRVYRKYLS